MPFPQPFRRGGAPGAALAALLLVAAGCAKAPAPPAADGPALTHLVLQTDWFAQPEHGGFYEALARGYYRDAGLDVEIRQGNPSTVPSQTVASGQADFAIGSTNDVLTAAGRGVPFLILGAFMERDPQAIMYHAESGIRGFKDLDGRKFMAVPGSPFLDYLQREYGIRFNVIPSDFGMNRFLADPAMIQQCFVTDEPYYVQQHGARIGVLLISDSGFKPYRAWYAKRSFCASHPEAVRAFNAATLRGWRDYLTGDRAAADAMISARNPKMDPAFIAFGVHAMLQYKLVFGDPADGEALGRIDPDRLAHMIAQFRGDGLIVGPLEVDRIYDPAFAAQPLP
jgi:NitT/TauT family transport system substrate-binding protein